MTAGAFITGWAGTTEHPLQSVVTAMHARLDQVVDTGTWPKHHRRAHDPEYAIVKLPGGKVAFSRRT